MTVQEVHDGRGGAFKLYMNDGTVWLAPREFSVIAGDHIRYKSDGDISTRAGSDALNFCYLTNFTRGSETAAERIDGPTKNTSCPATGSSKGEVQTDTKSAEAPPETQRTLTGEEIENYRKRNECEFRFWDNGVHEIEGKSVGAACKENPDRRPKQ